MKLETQSYGARAAGAVRIFSEVNGLEPDAPERTRSADESLVLRNNSIRGP